MNEQQQAIEAGNRLITVSAGAGTGKTWTLASRYISLLKSDFGIKDILTLTFTEKAAQEMRERIQKMIEDAGLESAHAHFDEAYISTIHSFAWRTLREAGLYADVDPGANIISQPQTDEFRASFARLLDERAGVEILSKYQPEAIAKLAEGCEDIHAGLGRTSDEFLKLMDFSDVLIEVKKLLAKKWFTAWENWREIFLDAEGTISAKLSEKKPPQYAQKFDDFWKIWRDKKKYDEGIGQIFFVSLFEDFLKGTILSSLEEFISPVLGKSLKEWRKEHENILFLSQNLDEKKIKSDFAQDFSERAEIMNLCAEGWETFKNARELDGLLSFADLIFLSAKFATAGKFRQVMIDEFQDTDPLQEKMIRSIAGTGSVFVVGDPKQSIYSFRNADLKIFSDYTAEAHKSENLYINMKQSFRMRSELYEQINEIFGKIWQNGLVRTMPNLKYEPLWGEKNPERDRETIPSFTKITEYVQGKEPVAETRERLFKKIAETLKKWRTHTIWDSETKSLRPLEWRDCTVLTPTRTSWLLMEEIFAAAGIPVSKDGGNAWFSHGEVLDIVSMLRAFADERDELANESWKRSIFFPNDTEKEKFMRTTAQLNGASGVLELLLDDQKWLLNVRPAHRQRTAENVRHAVSLAREYEKSIYKTLNGCAEWLSDALRSDDKFVEPQLNDVGNAVRFMTIHVAKGLEFPVAILCEAQKTQKKSGRKRNPSLIVSKYLGAFASSHKLFKQMHKLLNDEAETEEQQRCFYVAATRAKDALVICGIEGEDAEEDSAEDEKISDTISEIPSQLPQKKWLPLTLPAHDNSLVRISATSFALYEWCPHAWRRRYRQGLDLDWENHSDIALGSDVGSIIHRIISKWDFDEGSITKYLPEILTENSLLSFQPKFRAAFRALYAHPDNLRIVQKWLTDVSRSEIGKFLKNFNAQKTHQKLMRETSFKVDIGGVKIFGSIDLFWEDGGLHLRDWKTSSKMTELSENQLLFYAAALQKQFEGKKIASAALISARDGEETFISLDRLEGIEEKITRVAQNAARVWTKKTENCKICPSPCVGVF